MPARTAAAAGRPAPAPPPGAVAQGGDLAATGGAGGAHALAALAVMHPAAAAVMHPAAAAAMRPAAQREAEPAAAGTRAGVEARRPADTAAAARAGRPSTAASPVAELANEYSAAVPAAEACTPGAANQCRQLVPLSLSICTGCEHYVTNATTLNAIRAQWTNQGCNLTTALIVCPAVVCINPGTAGDCVAADGSANGVCGIGIRTDARQLTPAS